MTLRDLEDDLVMTLQSALPTINVMHGRYGDLNISTPAVMVYCEPAGFLREDGRYTSAHVTIAACSAEGDATESKFASLELLAQAMAALRPPARSAPAFDGYYDNIAVALVEYTLPL
ncbi:MAG: hypothetical protein KatS3mg038_3008 [Candidatus Kapaibacterium sp.]|jgi:hypothetical protein|nr:MAG: hypothetical protein KatS3mg038_3008 [Candidatus Kapabacteria bacterium]